MTAGAGAGLDGARSELRRHARALAAAALAVVGMIGSLLLDTRRAGDAARAARPVHR